MCSNVAEVRTGARGEMELPGHARKPERASGADSIWKQQHARSASHRAKRAPRRTEEHTGGAVPSGEAKLSSTALAFSSSAGA
eukprot:3566974-Rhodomonas_salina.2